MFQINSVLSSGSPASSRTQAVVGPFDASVVGSFTADKIELKRKAVNDDDSLAQTIQTWYDSFSVNGQANCGTGWEYWFVATNLTAGTPTVRLCVPEPRFL